jgi:hypothetical protein
VATATAASAADSPTSVCTPGVTTHPEYKWVPDKVNAGPTQWTTDDAPANTARHFVWKGAPVGYHRDGVKNMQVVDATCQVQAPVFSVDRESCSVTVPYVEGIETRLYGVNGYPETAPITADTTISAGLDGTFGTAPQFWIGYTAKPGFVLTGTGTTHVDFYHGDYTADCEVPAA